MNTIFHKLYDYYNYTFIPLLIMTSVLLLLGGCGTKQSAPAENEIPDTTNINGTSAPAPLTDYVSEDYMALADMWGSCDDTALAAVMNKAADGEPVTIACIGGSITQGTISSGEDDSALAFRKCYADIFFQWWEDSYPDTEFTFINAGIGATDSYLGVHRVRQDVLDADPDLVLVEFSVNDGASPTDKRNYDNLVRRILSAENHPAVMLLFMGQTNGYSAQDIHALIGFNYQLPMVSYINVIDEMMAKSDYTANELSGDTTHPSALGHAIAGEILWKYLSNVYAQRESFGKPQPFAQSAVTNDVYLDSEIIDSMSLAPTETGTFEESSVFEAFPNDYTCSEGDGGLTFTVNCKRLGILYYRTTDGKSGQFEVYVDGGYVSTLDADFSNGWGNCADAKEVFASEEAAEHTVLIRKAADSSGDGFTLLGVLAAH
ncbi:MAG: SGNH/GDSL hydrolase family protein [Lachnospiraceae bacterium]|nr:SGNH/GDSL hydrolase family protein [Lachnospiraceae bacterium]